jgi:hypothetical protein
MVMGSFSIWHWIIVILFFVAPWGIGKVVVGWSSGRVAPLNRMGFLVWIVALLVASFIFGAVAPGSPALLLLYPISWVLLPWLGTKRSADAGRGEGYARWSAFPVVGIVCLILLLMLPTKAEGSEPVG